MYEYEERLVLYCRAVANTVITKTSNKSDKEQNSCLAEALTKVLLTSYNAGVKQIVIPKLISSNYASLRSYLCRSVLPTTLRALPKNLRKTYTLSKQSSNDTTSSITTEQKDVSIEKQESIFAAPPKLQKGVLTTNKNTIHSFQEFVNVLNTAPFSFFDHVVDVEFMYICTELGMTRPFVPSCVIAGINEELTELSELLKHNNEFADALLKKSSHMQSHLHNQSSASLCANSTLLYHTNENNNNYYYNNINNNISANQTVTEKNKECTRDISLEANVELKEVICMSNLKECIEENIDNDAQCKYESHFTALPTLAVFSLHEEEKMLERMFYTARSKTNTHSKSNNINNKADVEEYNRRRLKCEEHYEKEYAYNKSKQSKNEKLFMENEWNKVDNVVSNKGVFTLNEIVNFFNLKPYQAHKNLFECPRCHESFLRRTNDITLECLRCRYNAEFELLHHPLRSHHAQLYQWSYIVNLVNKFTIRAEEEDCSSVIVASSLNEIKNVGEQDRREAEVKLIMEMLTNEINRSVAIKTDAECQSDNLTESLCVGNDQDNNTNNTRKYKENDTKAKQHAAAKEELPLIEIIRESISAGVHVFVEHCPEHLLNLIQLQSGAARRVSTIPRLVNVQGKKRLVEQAHKSFEILRKLLKVNAYAVWVTRLRRHVKEKIIANYRSFVMSSQLTEYNSMPIMLIIYALINAAQTSNFQHARELLTYSNNSNNNNHYQLLFTISTIVVKLIFTEKLVEHVKRKQNKALLQEQLYCKEQEEEEEEEEHKQIEQEEYEENILSSEHSFASSALESLELKNHNEENCEKDEERYSNDNIQHSTISAEDDTKSNKIVCVTHETCDINQLKAHKYINNHNDDNDVVNDNDEETNSNYVEEYNWHSYLKNDEHIYQPEVEEKFNYIATGSECNNNVLDNDNDNSNIMPMQIPLTLDNLHAMQRRQQQQQQHHHHHQQEQEEEKEEHKYKRKREEMKHTHSNPVVSNYLECELPEQKKITSEKSLSQERSSSYSSYAYSYSYSYSNNSHSQASSEYESNENSARSKASSFSLRSYYANDGHNIRGTCHGNATNASRGKQKTNKATHKSKHQRERDGEVDVHTRPNASADGSTDASENVNRSDSSLSKAHSSYEHQHQQQEQKEMKIKKDVQNEASKSNIVIFYYIAFCEVFGTISVSHIKHYYSEMKISEDVNINNTNHHHHHHRRSKSELSSASHLPTPASHLWMPYLQRCTQGGMSMHTLITEFIKRVKELTQHVRLIQD